MGLTAHQITPVMESVTGNTPTHDQYWAYHLGGGLAITHAETMKSSESTGASWTMQSTSLLWHWLQRPADRQRNASMTCAEYKDLPIDRGCLSSMIPHSFALSWNLSSFLSTWRTALAEVL